MDQADPDFLALPPRIRTRIDRAFDRGLPKVRSSGRKRRKLNRDGEAGPSRSGRLNTYDDEGGFLEGGDNAGGHFNEGAEGGFMLEDDGGGEGGFMVDDDEGGFIPDDPDPETTSRHGTPSSPARATLPITAPVKPLRSGKVPLSSIPRLLALLNLPADEDVINVFKASAKGWAAEDDANGTGEADRRRTRGRGEESEDKLGVERNDFRAVCAAIMDGAEDDDGDQGEMEIDKDEPEGEEGEDSDSEDDEDAFELDEGSELSSLSSDSEYGASRQKTRATGAGGKGKETVSATATPKKTRRKKTDLVEQVGTLKLVGRQREVARELWDMMKGPAVPDEDAKKTRKGDASAYVLGRDEVKKWVREMGEMWTEDEITDMVSLFSTQHEGRGLSFDDFGQVMLRARVI